MTRNKPRQHKIVRPGAEVEVKEVMTTKELPTHYIGLRDDLNYAQRRIRELEEKLLARGLKVIWPLRIYRYTCGVNVRYKGKKAEPVIREKPWSMLCVELESV